MPETTERSADMYVTCPECGSRQVIMNLTADEIERDVLLTCDGECGRQYSVSEYIPEDTAA